MSAKKSAKTLMYLTTALVSSSVVAQPMVAEAEGLSQLGTWHRANAVHPGISNLECDGVPQLPQINNIRQMNLPRQQNANTSAFRSNVQPGVNPNVSGNVTGNIGLAKPL